MAHGYFDVQHTLLHMYNIKPIIQSYNMTKKIKVFGWVKKFLFHIVKKSVLVVDHVKKSCCSQYTMIAPSPALLAGPGSMMKKQSMCSYTECEHYL